MQTSAVLLSMAFAHVDIKTHCLCSYCNNCHWNSKRNERFGALDMRFDIFNRMNVCRAYLKIVAQRLSFGFPVHFLNVIINVLHMENV